MNQVPVQPGILAPLPPHAKYLLFRLIPGVSPRSAVQTLVSAPLGDAVIGLGASLVRALDQSVPGLRSFPILEGAPFELPATPFALLIWLRGADRGELAHRATHWIEQLSTGLHCEHIIDAFKYDSGRDLTGYEDGTENPEGEAAVDAAVSADGSSYLAWQQWQHAWDRFAAMTSAQQDLAIGRRRGDNDEIDEAPPSAHVKRTAQESFSPEAFVLRRSMPWSAGRDLGLVFAAFGRSVDAFEAQWRRMAGLDDGVTDALFQFTRPLSGAYFWCPPLLDDHLDLTRITA